MQEFIEQILDLSLSLKSAYTETERFLRTKLLSASLALIQGARRAFVLHQCMVMACFVWALSFFTTGLILCFPWAFEPSYHPHPALLFSSATLGSSSLLIYFFWREKTWLKATGIQDLLDGLEKEVPPPALNRRELAALMDELLDEKLAKLARSRRAASEDREPEPVAARTG